MAKSKGIIATTIEKASEKGSQSTERAEFIESDSKKAGVTTVEYAYSDEEKHHDTSKPPTTARDLVTEVLVVEDDPSVNPWTFRMWFIGIGMAVFGGYVQDR
jgi:hypothetical protein